ncbi:hypothetical protein, partial [uncultured Desulfovibrio sp.]|uniref:hypothetical protein n=1 Tax=uncultured Desulfovibrio sp. TaxID=167968 RepID=UPI00263A0B00
MGGITNKTVHLSFAVDWSKEVNPLLFPIFGLIDYVPIIRNCDCKQSLIIFKIIFKVFEVKMNHSENFKEK